MLSHIAQPAVPSVPSVPSVLAPLTGKCVAGAAGVHDDDGMDGVNAELLEVQTVLKRHYRRIISVYYYYCTLGDVHDGYAMGKSSYFDFLRHIGAIDEESEHCNVAGLEAIFAAANVDERGVGTFEQRDLSRVNSEGALMRFESLPEPHPRARTRSAQSPALSVLRAPHSGGLPRARACGAGSCSASSTCPSPSTWHRASTRTSPTPSTTS